VLAAAFGPRTSVLMMTGRHRAAAVIHAVSLPVQALLSAFLIGSLGVRGAALAAATGLLLTQFVLYVIASRNAES
jgi:O-antigen/teichoic acid export membrane protein